ncbi:MAG: hypothetical protein ABIV47_16025 [Roseiflexaceae bacterium]
MPFTAGWSELKAAVERAGYGVIETDATDGASSEDVEAARADKRRKLIVGVALGCRYSCFRWRATSGY